MFVIKRSEYVLSGSNVAKDYHATDVCKLLEH